MELDRGLPVVDIVELAKGTPWLFEEGFEISESEGYRDGKFGCRTAFHRSLDSLYHEVAHAVEFYLDDPSKIGFHSFEFHVPTEFVFDRYCQVPKTTKAIERELRTFAIQARITEANSKIDFDLEHFLQYSGELMFLMPDWINISVLHVQHAEGEPHEERESKRVGWCIDKIRQYLNDYSIEQIVETWPKVMSHIRTLKPVDD